MPEQRAMAGEHDRHNPRHDQQAEPDPQVAFDVRDQPERSKPLQYASDCERRITVITGGR